MYAVEVKVTGMDFRRMAGTFATVAEAEAEAKRLAARFVDVEATRVVKA